MSSSKSEEQEAPRAGPAEPGRHDVRARLDVRPAESLGHRRRPRILDQGGRDPRAAAGRQAQGHLSGSRTSRSTRRRPTTRTRLRRQKTGITCWQFPEWFITQGALATESGRATRSRRLIPRSSLTKGKFIDDNKQAQPVVPVRFVRACRKGHIGDIDWYYFVHRGANNCRRDLWIDERGTSGDLSEVWVRCECKAERPMIDATKSEMHALGRCDGWQPWLGPRIREACDEQNRMLVRTASNAYFPQTMSVISLPDRE